MHIVFHAHNAEVTDTVQRRAELAVRKLGARLRRAVDATVRFASDGPTRRVEITLRAPRQRDLVAAGAGRAYEVALAGALARLEAHVAHARSARERRIRVAARARQQGRSPDMFATDGDAPDRDRRDPARRDAGPEALEA